MPDDKGWTLESYVIHNEARTLTRSADAFMAMLERGGHGARAPQRSLAVKGQPPAEKRGPLRP